MDNFIYWLGLVHAAFYMIAGTVLAMTFLLFQIHKWAGLIGQIVKWHYAKARWDAREKRGLSGSEWKRGEPKP